MKNSSFHSLLVALVVVILAIQVVLLFEVYSLASNGSSNQIFSNIGHISISATGTASAQPTMGMLYLSVQGTGKTAVAATANLSASLAQMNTSLSGYVNKNASQIKTTYYNLYNQTANYYYPGAGYTAYNGFIAAEQLTVTIPNIQNLSNAIGSLSSINGIQITSASASLSNAQTTALRTAAFSNAIQNATSQASILTGNAALSTQNITVNSYLFYPIAYANGNGSSAGPTIGKNTTVNPSFYSGTDSITESITVVFSYNK